MFLIRSVIAAALMTWTSLGAQPSSAAENYPASPVTIVVPYPAGGTADVLPRMIAGDLQAKWGRPVIIENRAGAGGNLGAEYVARANPDGYTLLASPPGPLAINQSLYKSLTYDPTRFVPITILASTPNVLAVSPQFKAGSIAALIKEAKEKPGKLNYASQGVGTTSHLATSMFEMKAAIKLVHIPYKGSAPALNDLIGGHVDIMFDNLGSSLPLHREGKLKILGVASLRRTPTLPDVPSIAESGLPDFQSLTWFGLVAPPNTPASVVAKINQDVLDSLRNPEIRKNFLNLAVAPWGSSPEQMATFMKEERESYAAVIKAANMTLE
jgi:tripartite-type tricarboxylate transporter receptor subunit TctC